MFSIEVCWCYLFFLSYTMPPDFWLYPPSLCMLYISGCTTSFSMPFDFRPCTAISNCASFLSVLLYLWLLTVCLCAPPCIIAPSVSPSGARFLNVCPYLRTCPPEFLTVPLTLTVPPVSHRSTHLSLCPPSLARPTIPKINSSNISFFVYFYLFSVLASGAKGANYGFSFGARRLLNSRHQEWAQ